MAAHTELLKFSSDLPSLQLSAGFNARLLQRVEQSTRERPVSHVNFWIKSYWVLATTLSLIVLFRVKLPPILDNPWLFPLSIIAIASFALFPFLPARHAKRIAYFLGLTANWALRASRTEPRPGGSGEPYQFSPTAEIRGDPNRQR